MKYNHAGYFSAAFYDSVSDRFALSLVAAGGRVFSLSPKLTKLVNWVQLRAGLWLAPWFLTCFWLENPTKKPRSPRGWAGLEIVLYDQAITYPRSVYLYDLPALKLGYNSP